jgi:hypothetical protein
MHGDNFLGVRLSYRKEPRYRIWMSDSGVAPWADTTQKSRSQILYSFVLLQYTLVHMGGKIASGEDIMENDLEKCRDF